MYSNTKKLKAKYWSRAVWTLYQSSWKTVPWTNLSPYIQALISLTQKNLHICYAYWKVSTNIWEVWNPVYHVHDTFDCRTWRWKWHKKLEIQKFKYSLMPIGASRYNILKTIYKISTWFIREWVRYGTLKLRCVCDQKSGVGKVVRKRQ